MAASLAEPRRVRVKMCGTTRIEDALAAVRCGVDALGFIFYGKSPRYIAPDRVAVIIKELPPFVDRVGVFVNAARDDVAQIAGCGLSYVQLHGDETPAYCRAIREMAPACGLIKAFRVRKESRAEDFAPYQDCADAFLLDTYAKGLPGGTGLAFDWSMIEGLALRCPVILAGGITPENVASSLAEVRPYAIDVNSGVEHEPGVKDHERLARLMRLVAEHNSR